MKISMRKLKLIIENYLSEAEEVSAAPEEEEVSAVPEEEVSKEDPQKDNAKKEEEQAKNIAADIAMIASKKGPSAAVDELNSILKHRDSEFEVDISTIPALVEIFGKKAVKKVDLENLKELPSHRTSRSQEILSKIGAKPGGFD